ncbi:pentatricopeptide repeat-containing protein [Cucumis melo var. makuwa]|uniref:Pentatricopeptide repeat-containing protein n=1 Tax=Cucumis melo var. makuwa TaxID=1194695 RepID=A0A5D3DZF5_CUCMM|nr:pentatricopeptide repeat-containing protein [Cucumis melo var. makuwa]
MAKKLHDRNVELRPPPAVLNGYDIMEQVDSLEFPVIKGMTIRHGKFKISITREASDPLDVSEVDDVEDQQLNVPEIIVGHHVVDHVEDDTLCRVDVDPTVVERSIVHHVIDNFTNNDDEQLSIQIYMSTSTMSQFPIDFNESDVLFDFNIMEFNTISSTSSFGDTSVYFLKWADVTPEYIDVIKGSLQEQSSINRAARAKQPYNHNSDAKETHARGGQFVSQAAADADNGPVDEALKIFVEMIKCGVEPDEVMLASVVSACATISAIKEGNALLDMYAKCNRLNEARIIFDMMPIRTVVSETSMVSGYGKASKVKVARYMFSNMMVKDVITWNALIAGCTQNGENEEALILFRLLKRESVSPTHYTFGNLLNACANLADLQLGRQAHSHVLKHGFRFQYGEDSDVFVGKFLIDMYMKCGSVENGCRVFQHMLERDCVSWNAMIVGYAQNGFGNKALEVFSKMLESGEGPDHVTMIGVLSTCSHAGLLDEGRYYFRSMTAQHEEMSMQPDAIVWGSLLAACKVHRNIQLGEYVVEKLLEVDPENSRPYVLLSNMYAENKDWKNVVRRKKGILKQRLKIPPSSNQFTKTFDKNLATNLFKMLLKYRAKGQITEKVEVEFSRILEVI